MKTETTILSLLLLALLKTINSLEYARFVRYGCARFDGWSSESKGTELTLMEGLKIFMDDPNALYVQFNR